MSDLRSDIIAGGVLLMAREIEGLDEACGFVVRVDGLNGGADGRGCCCGIAALKGLMV